MPRWMIAGMGSEELERMNIEADEIRYYFGALDGRALAAADQSIRRRYADIVPVAGDEIMYSSDLPGPPAGNRN